MISANFPRLGASVGDTVGRGVGSGVGTGVGLGVGCDQKTSDYVKRNGGDACKLTEFVKKKTNHIKQSNSQ